jgi:hypothetical protein
MLTACSRQSSHLPLRVGMDAEPSHEVGVAPSLGGDEPGARSSGGSASRTTRNRSVPHAAGGNRRRSARRRSLRVERAMRRRSLSRRSRSRRSQITGTPGGASALSPSASVSSPRWTITSRGGGTVGASSSSVTRTGYRNRSARARSRRGRPACGQSSTHFGRHFARARRSRPPSPLRAGPRGSAPCH